MGEELLFLIDELQMRKNKIWEMCLKILVVFVLPHKNILIWLRPIGIVIVLKSSHEILILKKLITLKTIKFQPIMKIETSNGLNVINERCPFNAYNWGIVLL